MDKIQARRIGIANRNALNNSEYHMKSKTIHDFVINHECIARCDTVYVYVSYKQEVDTHLLIESLLKLEKNVAVPKVNPLSKTMDFHYISSLNELKQGYMKIQEPAKDRLAIQKGLIILPMSSFDKYGNRTGYGGGYYDKYLAERDANLIKIGIAFSNQEMPHIVAEPFDIKLDYIITEQGERWINK